MAFKDFWDKLWHPRPSNARWAPTASGYAPIYSQFGANIYASDVVQQALKCIVDELKKLIPRHVRYVKSDPVPVQSDIQDVLNDPNPLMTTSEFIEKIAWLLLMNYNAFVIPTYYTWTDEKTGETRRRYESLWPIQPTNVDFIEDASGRLFVTFMFMNGQTTTIPYDDVIHIRYNYSVNQFMGGNELGQPDHAALLKTLELNKQLLDGVAKAMNSSYAVNGIIKYNTLLSDDKIEAGLAEFERKLRNSESGFLPVDIKAEFVPFEKKSEIVDDNTLKFIDAKILRNFGVPLDILSGDYDTENYNSFYQKSLEPIILAFSQAFTKKLFTKRERAFGNRIQFYPEELVFLSMDQRIRVVEQLAPTGGLFENEKRTMFGLPPIPELEGKRFMSLNWINANDASQYQVGKVNVDVVDETKQEV